MSPDSTPQKLSAAQLAAATPLLLALVSKSAVLLVLSVLSELLMYGKPHLQQQLLQEAGTTVTHCTCSRCVALGLILHTSELT
jgi:hypothetical protein